MVVVLVVVVLVCVCVYVRFFGFCACAFCVCCVFRVSWFVFGVCMCVGVVGVWWAVVVVRAWSPVAGAVAVRVLCRGTGDKASYRLWHQKLTTALGQVKGESEEMVHAMVREIDSGKSYTRP